MFKSWFKKKEPESFNYNLVWEAIKFQSDRTNKLEKELHGWQTTTYQLMNALNIDLTLDENGQVLIKKRKVPTRKCDKIIIDEYEQDAVKKERRNEL
jgi:hypothetical protein